MSDLSFGLGRLLTRLRREGIPTRAALCETVREARRAFESGRVPEWLILEVLADAERSDVIDHPDPAGQFWFRLLRSMERALRKVEADPIPKRARTHGSEIYWLVGEVPRVLLHSLRYASGIEFLPCRVEHAVERPADERLLALPAEIAPDAVPLVLGLGEQVPLTGLIVTGLEWPLRDAALLVLGPATGIPVQWMSFHEDGRDVRRVTATSAVRLLVGEHIGIELQAVLAPYEKGCDSTPTTLPDMYELFTRLIERRQLRFALEMMPAHMRSTERWDLDELEKQIQGTQALLGSMTEEERRAPERIDDSSLDRIAAVADVKPEQVRRLIRDYLARRDLAAPPRDGT